MKSSSTPLEIGPVTVKNRFMVTAHWIKMAATDPHGYHTWFYFGERAQHYWAELPHVFTPSEVMEGKLDGAKTVAIIDAVGFYQSTDPLE